MNIHKIDDSLHNLRYTFFNLDGLEDSLVRPTVRKSLRPDKCFNIEPRVILFNNFSSGNEYRQKIKIINLDSNSHQLNIYLKNSPDLAIRVTGNQKMVPGLSVDVEVIFNPREMAFYVNDLSKTIPEIIVYSPELSFSTVIPIIMKPRPPSLVIPNDVIMADTSPYVTSYYTIFIVNLDNEPHHISILPIDESEIQIKPRNLGLTINANDNLTLTIEYTPVKVGNFEEVLTVKFLDTVDTEDTITVKIHSELCKVTLDTKRIKFHKTYIGLSEQQSFYITNHGTKMVAYKWLALPNRQEDNNFRKLLKDSYEGYLNYETNLYNDLLHRRIIEEPRTHQMILEHHYNINTRLMAQLDFYFQNKAFHIIPKEGVIYPNSKALIQVFFKPPSEIPFAMKRPLDFDTFAYLWVNTDPNNRIPLELEGEGLGPLIKLNISEINIGKITLGEKHWFEIVAGNTGPNSGRIIYKSSKCNFGGHVKVEPIFMELEPKHHSIFMLEYYNTNVGFFLETISFQVLSGEKIDVIIKGQVLGISATIIPDCVDFGPSPICCLQTSFITISNSTLANFSWKAEFSFTGNNSPLSFTDFHSSSNQFETKGAKCDKQLLLSSDISRYNISEVSSDLMPNRVEVLSDDMFNLSDSESHEKDLWSYEKEDYCVKEMVQKSARDLLQKTFEMYTKDLDKDSITSAAEGVEEIVEVLQEKFDIHLTKNLAASDAICETLDIVFDYIDRHLVIEGIIDQLFEAYVFACHCLGLDHLDYTAYNEQNWILPPNPIEYYITPTCGSLKPNERNEITIYFIPNCPGPFQTIVNFYIKYINDEENLVSALIDEESPYNTTKQIVTFHHDCIVPELILTPTERTVTGYVDAERTITLQMKNPSRIMMFVFIINQEFPGIIIKYDTMKWHLNSCEQRSFKITVKPVITGIHVTEILFQVLGKNQKYIYKLTFHAKPPKLTVIPRSLKGDDIPVLTVYKRYILIKNESPTIAKFHITQRKDDNTECFPAGLILGPRQLVIIVVWSFFRDAGTYKNLLQIHNPHLDPIDVPFVCKAIGSSLEFAEGFLQKVPSGSKECMKPNGYAHRVLDFGYIYVMPEPHCKFITVKNRGRKLHSVFVIFKVSNHKRDEITQHFIVQPDEFQIKPFETVEMQISIKSTIVQACKEDFTIDAVVHPKPMRVPQYHIVMMASFVKPCLEWSHKNVVFDIYYNEEGIYDNQITELITMHNCGKLAIMGAAQVEGEFFIFHQDDIFQSKMCNIYMEPNDYDYVTIQFNDELIAKNRLAIQYMGKLKTYCLGRPMPALNIIASITYPLIEVFPTVVKLVTIQTSAVASIQLHNPGPLRAKYQWSYIEGTFQYDEPIIPYCQNVMNFSEVIKSNVFPYFCYKKDTTNDYIAYWAEEDDDFPEGPPPPPVVEPPRLSAISTTKGKRKSATAKGRRSTARASRKENTRSATAQSRGRQSARSSTRQGRRRSSTKRGMSIVKQPTIINPEEFDIWITNQEKFEFFNKLVVELCKMNPLPLCKKRKELMPPHIMPKKDKCIRPEDVIRFDQMVGSLEPLETKFTTVGFASQTKEFDFYVGLLFDVDAGNTTNVEFTAMNCDPRIWITETNYEIGNKVWYEPILHKLRVFNISPIPLKLLTVFDRYTPDDHTLIEGFVKILPMCEFELPVNTYQQMSIISYMGVSCFFDNQFGIQVNNKPPIGIYLTGAGLIPLITVLNCDRCTLYSYNKTFEYEAIRHMFENCYRKIKIKPCEINFELVDQLRNALKHRHSARDKTPKKSGKASKSKRTASKTSTSKSTRKSRMKSARSSSSSSGSSSRRKSKRKASANLPSTKEIICHPSECLPVIPVNLSIMEGDPDIRKTMEAKPEYDETVCMGFRFINMKLFHVSGGRAVLKYDKKSEYCAEILEIADDDLADFVVLDYPEEYPTAIDITNYIQSRRFAMLLECDSDLRECFSKLFYLEVAPKMNTKYFISKNRYRRPIKPSSFLIKPIPYCLPEYEVNFCPITTSETFHTTLRFFFHGPGTLNAAIRTDCYIPGLRVELCPPDQCVCHKDVVNTRYTINNYVIDPPEHWEYKTYRNRFKRMKRQRYFDGYKICNCKCLGGVHSRDLNMVCEHTRDVKSIDLQAVKQHYTEISTLYRMKKDPNTHCEIYQELTIHNTAGEQISCKITFTPTREYYRGVKEFNEIIYLDIHLGPTIPIILKGSVHGEPIRDSEEEAEEASIDDEDEAYNLKLTVALEGNTGKPKKLSKQTKDLLLT